MTKQQQQQLQSYPIVSFKSFLNIKKKSGNPSKDEKWGRKNCHTHSVVSGQNSVLSTFNKTHFVQGPVSAGKVFIVQQEKEHMHPRNKGLRELRRENFLLLGEWWGPSKNDGCLSWLLKGFGWDFSNYIGNIEVGKWPQRWEERRAGIPGFFDSNISPLTYLTTTAPKLKCY